MQLGAEGRHQGKPSLQWERGLWLGELWSYWGWPLEGPALQEKKKGFFPCPCLAASRKPSQDLRGHWNKSSRLRLEVSFLKNSQPSAQLLPIILCLALPHGLASLFYSSTLVLLPSTPEGRSEQPCSVPCSTAVHMHDRWAVCLQLPSSQASERLCYALYWGQSSSSLGSSPFGLLAVGIKPGVFFMGIPCSTTELHPQPDPHPALWCFCLCFLSQVLM